MIENSLNKRFVSIASIWEIVIKASLDKLEFRLLPTELEAFLYKNDIELLNVDIRHLNTLLTLPHHHRDPFDRLLIAQAVSEGLAIISADRHFTPYPLQIVWQ